MVAMPTDCVAMAVWLAGCDKVETTSNYPASAAHAQSTSHNLGKYSVQELDSLQDTHSLQSCCEISINIEKMK